MKNHKSENDFKPGLFEEECDLYPISNTRFGITFQGYTLKN
jgi:hypothetical protein